MILLFTIDTFAASTSTQPSMLRPLITVPAFVMTSEPDAFKVMPFGTPVLLAFGNAPVATDPPVGALVPTGLLVALGDGAAEGGAD